MSQLLTAMGEHPNVVYIYTEDQESMLEVSVLDQVALNGLPPEIKIALVHAADLGDVNQMKKLVAQITSQNIELAQVPGGLGRCV